MLILSVCAAALIAQRAQPAPPTLAQSTAGSLAICSESAQRFSEALQRSVGIQEQDLCNREAADDIREQKERAAAAARRALEAWPTGCIRKIRADERWTFFGVPLHTSVSQFSSWFSDANTTPYGDETRKDFRIGSVYSASSKVGGHYDEAHAIRATFGPELEIHGERVIRVGDHAKTIEARLGLPDYAGYINRGGVYPSFEWHYRYSSVELTLTFKGKILQRIYLRDRSFTDSAC